MDYPIAYFRGVALIVSVFTLANCSSTKFTGDKSSLLYLDRDKTILIIDYISSGITEKSDGNIVFITRNLLEFDIMECTRLSEKSELRNCLSKCSSLYNASYVIFYDQHSFRPGKTYNRTYRDRSAHNNVAQNHRISDSIHSGSVEFVIYDSENGTVLSSFVVRSKVGGISIDDRVGEGRNNVNLYDPSVTIRRAKRKGIKNIKKRIKLY